MRVTKEELRAMVEENERWKNRMGEHPTAYILEGAEMIVQEQLGISYEISYELHGVADTIKAIREAEEDNV